MKTKIQYTVMYYSGRRGTKTVTYDCPDFEEQVFTTIFNLALPEPVILTVEKQIDSWVGEFDKTDFMNKNEIDIIFDWKVLSAKADKTKKELVISKAKLTNEECVKLYASFIEDERLKLDFIAVYSKMKHTVKDLHYLKQIKIVHEAQSVGYKSVIASFDRMNAAHEEIRKQIKGDGLRTDYIYRVTKDSVINELDKNNNL